MADVTMSFQVLASKGPFREMLAASGVTMNMAAANMMAVPASLSTSPVQLVTTSLSSLGLAVVENLGTGATHVVTFGRWDGTTLWGCASPRAGEKAILRLEPGNYAWKANAAGVPALVKILEG